MAIQLVDPFPVGVLANPLTLIKFKLVSDVANIDLANTSVWIDGQVAILAGVFQPGFAGLVINPPLEATYQITTHPALTNRKSDVVIQSKDTASPRQWLEYSVTPNLPGVTELRAKTWPEGKRIDLIFSVPAGVQQIRIRRSKLSYSSFTDDPGDDIYVGSPTNLDATPITRFYDGDVTDPVYRSSGASLEENCFYYYTIFVTYSLSAPEVWHTDPEARVQGLSIKDYAASEGDWVYKLLPQTYRQRDADPNRGTDQYKLRDFCKVMQAYASLQRGWQEALLMLRDPELMPAGRLGENQNQTGLLAAQVRDLGANPERSYDAGVLRRLTAGIVSVYQAKGTCPGLVNYVKLLTGWDSRCDEQIEPVCAVDRLFQLHDEESYILLADGTAGATPADIWVYQYGELFVPSGAMTEADGATVTVAPETSSAVPTVGAIIDALGTFVCVDEVRNISGGQRFVFTESHARLRAEITGDGLAGPPTERRFTIDSVDFTSPQGGWPWQFPSEEPAFMINGLKGLKLLDSANVLHTIESNDETSGGQTVVIVESGTGDPAAGVYSIAWDITTGATFADRIVHFYGRFLVGSHSLLMDPVWDVRLLAENVPSYWSLLVGFGSSIGVASYTPTPADVTVWVADQHEEIGKVGSRTVNTLTVPTATWTTDQRVGYYLLPNWNQTKTFRIVHNTSDTLVVSTFPSVQGLLGVTASECIYVILRDQNNVKYKQLVASLPSYLPYDCRGIVKFEPVFDPSHLSGYMSEYRADRGVQTDGSGNVESWEDFGPLAATAAQTNPLYRPAYDPSDTSGLPAIIFDGVDDHLVLNSVLSSLGLGNASFTIFVVCSTSVLGTALSHGHTTVANPSIAIQPQGGGYFCQILDDTGAGIVDSNPAGSSGGWDYVAFRYMPDGGSKRIRTNINGTSNLSFGSVGTVSLDIAAIGGFYNSGVGNVYDCLVGKLRHVIVFSEYLSVADTN